MGRDTGRKHYAGEGFGVSFDLGTCAHAGACVRGLPAVFQPKRRPWIDVSQATAEAIEAQVERCPSGALKFHRDG
jgi:uncharacterized Fe-S cluster protein YjdI